MYLFKKEFRAAFKDNPRAALELSRQKGKFSHYVVCLFLFLKMTLSEILHNHLLTRSAGLAFVLLSLLVPLLAPLAFLMGSTKEIEAALEMVLPFAPPLLLEYLGKFIANAQKLTGIGISVLIIMSVGLFGAVEESLNTIWKTRGARSYFARLRTFSMVMLYSPLLFFASFTFRNSKWFNFLSDYFFLLDLLPFLLMVMAFSTLIWFIPNTPVKLRSSFFGGLVAAGMFELVRRGFATYVKLSVQTQTIYGIFGIIPFFLVSLFVVAFVFLTGAEIAYVHQNFYPLLRSRKQWNRRVDNHKPYIGLRILIDIVAAFLKRATPPTASYFAKKFELSEAQTSGILKSLMNAGYVNDLQDGKGFVPRFDYSKEKVKTALDMLEDENRQLLAVPEDRVKGCVAAFLRAKRIFADQKLEAMTFEELLVALHEMKNDNGTLVFSSGNRHQKR
jgi:YihY family inner membrane protein